MKIMLISGEYPPRIGGVADYTCHLAQALARLGHHVSVLTTANGRSDGWAMEADGDVEVYRDVRDWRCLVNAYLQQCNTRRPRQDLRHLLATQKYLVGPNGA